MTKYFYIKGCIYHEKLQICRQFSLERMIEDENAERERETRGRYSTREDEELCDLGIAQEGRCMQRGALL